MNQSYSNYFYPYNHFVENTMVLPFHGRVPVLDLCMKPQENAVACRNYMCSSGIERPNTQRKKDTLSASSVHARLAGGSSGKQTHAHKVSLSCHMKQYTKCSRLVALPLCATDSSLSPLSTTSSEPQPTSPYTKKETPTCNTSPNLAKIQKRPFKCFPKDSMTMALEAANAEAFLTGNSVFSAENYAEFRSRMLAKVQSDSSSSSPGAINKNMRRYNHHTEKMANPQSEDGEYLEKRRRNNEAARKSREARKAKEDELAIRCAFLEQENIRLKIKLSELENERNLLQRVMY